MAKKVKGKKLPDSAFPERDLTELVSPEKNKESEWVKLWRRMFPPGPLRASHQSVTVFTRQFAVLLNAGVPLVQAFDSFQDPNEPVHKAVAELGRLVQSGHRLSHALKSFPKIFSQIYCGLIESGEKTGQLVDVLNKLADDLEKELKMKRRLVAALTYPGILLLSAFVCVTFFVTTIMPLLEPMFTGMHIQLPLATRILMHAKDVLIGFVTISIIVGVSGFFIYRAMARSPVRLRLIHRLILYFPLIGPLYKMMTITRILQSMATMIEVGMTMVHSFQSCETLTSNTYLAFQMSEMRKSVIDGNTIAESMGRVNLFPRSSVQLIIVGEESSNLIQMFNFAAKILEEDFELAVDQLATNLEPVIMMVMGVVVGFIVLGAMLPIVQLLQNL